MANIVSTGLSESDIKFIKSVSLKILLKFLGAEFIGFGFGVPLAVILAIGYGNIADIFMDVYFVPIVITTVIVVLFVALPTNIFLTRKLIKVILNPTFSNIKEFSIDLPSIPITAALNLFLRISIGGFIADVWGYLIHSGISTEQFIALFSAPIYGAFSAAVIYFFVLQMILASFNIKLREYIKFDRSEILDIKLLSFVRIYPSLIAFSLLLAFSLISLGEILKAGFWGYVLISLSMFITVSVVFFFANKVLNISFSNAYKILSEWYSSKKTVVLMGLYDIEEVIRSLESYSIFYIELESELVDYSRYIKNVLEVMELNNKKLFSYQIAFNKVNLDQKLEPPDYSSIRNDFDRLASSLREVSSSISTFNANSSKFSSLLSGFSEEILSIVDVIRAYLNRVGSLSFQTSSEPLKIIESEVDYLVAFTKDQVLKNLSQIEKISKDMEMIFLNFQLEMSKIGYLEEFRAISSQVNKVLRSLNDLIKNIYSLSRDFERDIKSFYEEVKRNFVLFETSFLEFSDIIKKGENISKILNQVLDSSPRISEVTKHIYFSIEFSTNFKYVFDLNILVSRLSLSKKMVSNWINVFNSVGKKHSEIANKNVEILNSVKNSLESLEL
ncbi:MAG: hypothetical protein ACPL4C_04485 [Brevinematia bacterium]